MSRRWPPDSSKSPSGKPGAVHSRDADHVLTDLRHHFDEVLAQLESVAGWRTARVARPVQILGCLDGIETGVCQLIRDEPLETTALDHRGATLTIPTEFAVLAKLATSRLAQIVLPYRVMAN